MRVTYKVSINDKDNKEFYNIKVPYWRVDINICEDIIEDIVRFYGYNKIKLEKNNDS